MIPTAELNAIIRKISEYGLDLPSLTLVRDYSDILVTSLNKMRKYDRDGNDMALRREINSLSRAVKQLSFVIDEEIDCVLDDMEDSAGARLKDFGEFMNEPEIGLYSED